ncbi:hypothetical protein HPB48_010427 [Haemaphysalis longicornis]|uniref:Peptidase M13 N-terminal domain-containing protein n=1 Tax=Haemaphysalis longicornis TaxID=44386 RepID=A0A9J6H529_HAELO|nr:hypothetical protein HPB48_010427 [Haemaphysalis longicornis]
MYRPLNWSTTRTGSETGELLFPREGTWTTAATGSAEEEASSQPFTSSVTPNVGTKSPFSASPSPDISDEDRATPQSSQSRRSGGKKSRRSESKRSRGKSKRRSEKSQSAVRPSRMSAEERTTRTHAVPIAEGYATAAVPPQFWCFLCTTCAIFVLLIVCLIALYYVCGLGDRHSTTARPTTKSSPGPGQVYYCSSDYCRREAQHISSLLQKHSDPCENFYQHVCGVWATVHHAQTPLRASLISQDTLLQDVLTRQLLENVRGTQYKDVQVAADLYNRCTDPVPMAVDYQEALKAIFAQWDLEPWPFTAPVNSGSVGVFKLGAELVRDLALATIIAADVGIHPENLDATSLELDKPRFLLCQADAHSNMVTRLFSDAVQEAASNLGASPTPPGFTEKLMEVSAAFGALGCPTDSAGGFHDHFAVVTYDQLGEGLSLFLKVLLANLRTQKCRAPRRLSCAQPHT